MIVWHLDRLYRQSRELEQLLDLLDSHPVQIESVQGGSFDLNRHEGRLFARQLVAFANYESALKGARVSRAHQQRAKRGSWHGRAGYGHHAGGSLDADQHPVLRRIARDYLAGCSETEIARRLNTDGIPTPGTSTRWRPSTVQAILRSNRLHGHRITKTGEHVDAAWESAITSHESAVIRALQLLPQHRTTNSSRSLLGGLASCAACDRTMVVHYSGRVRRYVCLRRDGGCGNGIAADALDGTIRARLSQAEPLRAATRPANDLVDEADRLCQQLADNVATFVRGDRPHHEFTAISRRLQQEAEWLSSVVVTKAPGRQGAWLEFPLPEQRRIIQQRVAAIFIGPSSAPGKFDPDRLQIQIALVSAWVAEACGAPIGPRDRGAGIVGREAGVGSHTEMDPGSPEHAPCLPPEGRERVKRPHRNVL